MGMCLLFFMAAILLFGCGDNDEPTKLTLDECPIPDFDIDWKGVAVFDAIGSDRGTLLLSNGSVGVLVLSDESDGGYDLLAGGKVTNSTHISVTHIAINSIVEGQITSNEVVRDETECSKIFLLNDNATFQYQLGVEESGSVSYLSSRTGCEANVEQYAPDVARRLLAFAADLTAIMETN